MAIIALEVRPKRDAWQVRAIEREVGRRGESRSDGPKDPSPSLHRRSGNAAIAFEGA